MRTTELVELKSLQVEDLVDKLKGSRRELYELRFKMAVGQLENHQQIRRVRRDIARILTVMHEREDELVLVAGPMAKNVAKAAAKSALAAAVDAPELAPPIVLEEEVKQAPVAQVIDVEPEVIEATAEEDPS
jgi:large subunit ribosomal protein L29